MEERRKSYMQMNQEDRDRFIRMEEKLDAALQTMNHHRSDFKQHIREDKEAFDKVEREFGKVEAKIGWLQKIVFMGLGALALLKMFLK